MQQEKVWLAKKLIGEWGKTDRRIEWKDWIARRTLGSDFPITVHWLTRAINNRSIEAPRKSRQQI
jgi:hypothetical protein